MLLNQNADRRMVIKVSPTGSVMQKYNKNKKISLTKKFYER